MINKILFSIITMILLLWSSADAWYYAIYPGDNHFSSEEKSTTEFHLPAGVHILYLDPVQIVLDDPAEIAGIQDYVRENIANLRNGGSLQYKPNGRDCDDFACILKGTAAYYGAGNMFGIMLDLVRHHAANVFWYDFEKDDNAVLWVIEPQSGDVYECPNNRSFIMW